MNSLNESIQYIQEQIEIKETNIKNLKKILGNKKSDELVKNFIQERDQLKAILEYLYELKTINSMNPVKGKEASYERNTI